MTVKIWKFKAMDTLFFRDGTPHNAGEGGGIGIKSIFPPYMFTLQGAVRTGLAIGQGWFPRGDVPFPKELGNKNEYGDISFEGPYLEYNDDYIFDVPLDILHNDKNQFSRIIPGKKLYNTDIGDIKLPVLTKDIKGAKTVDSFMVKRKALVSILNGEKDTLKGEDFYKNTEIWKEEERVGIGIDRATGTAQDKMLYFTSHIRPEPGLSMAIKVKGIDKNWHQKVSSICTLGGEGRLATIQIADDKKILPPMPKLAIETGKVKFTVILVTPGCIWPLESIEDMSESMENLIKKGYPHIPGNCISACIGKMKQVGGFDLETRKPRPLTPMLPPGSLWFYEGDAKDIDILKDLHGKVTNPLGFNQIIIGNWGV